MGDIRNMKQERKLINTLTPLFNRATAGLLKDYKKYNKDLNDLELDLLISKHFGVDFIDEMTSTVAEAAIASAQLGSNRIIYQNNAVKPGAKRYKPLNSVVRGLIRDSVFNASASTMARLKGDVKKVFLESYDERQSPGKIVKNLNDYFNYMKRYELKRIARTEINSFHNQGGFITKQQEGIEYHMWITSDDERVRSSHSDLHGEIVRVGDEFSNGLKYPGDKTGEVKEFINCRCITRAFFIPDGYIVPYGMIQFRESDLIKN
jgi:SPP1 gp7 family putative phage head morphogenesis protein